MGGYLAPNPKTWKGRTGEEPRDRLFQNIRCLDLSNGFKEDFHGQNAYGFLGFASDEGVRRNRGRPGAIKGPKELRQVLASVPLHAEGQFFDCGDVLCMKELELAQADLAEAVFSMLRVGLKPIVLGGGHEVAWGHYQGIAKLYHPNQIGIVNFDAHFDLRPLEGGEGSSGTPFRQVANFCKEQDAPFKYACVGIQELSNTPSLFRAAEELGAKYLSAEELYQSSPEGGLQFLDSFLADCEKVYVTCCLDVFSGACAPGVSAVNPAGLFPRDLLPFFRHLKNSGKVISCDIAEYAPDYDVNSLTAKLAAWVIQQLI